MKTESEQKVEWVAVLDRGYSYIHAKDEVFGGQTVIARELTPEHAAFIVKACNAHDALVEALGMLRDFQNGPPLFKHQKQWNEAMAKTEAALNLAGKEGE